MKATKRFLVLAFWLAAGSTAVWPAPAGATANFNYDTKITYKAVSDDTIQVTENYTVTNNTARSYLTGLQLTTPNESLTGLKVNYSDGTTIPATTVKKSGAKGDVKYDYQEIDITFPRQIYGSGRTWSFSLSYTATGLIETKGASHTVYVPAIDAGDPGDDYKVTVDVPTSYGTPHFPGAKSANAGTSGDRQFYNFEKADLVQSALALAFGDTTVYQLNFNFPLHNAAPYPQTLTLTLPPDLNNQRSYVNKLDPAPANLHLDEDGNVLADYHLAPHQSLTVKTDISGEVHYLEYSLAQSGKKADIPADLVKKYTSASRYWQTDGAVAAAASKLNDPNAPTINNVKAMYQFVIDKLTYNPDKIKFNIRQGAAAALANPNNAVCLEYADLLIAMLRSQGIPARMPVGYGYSGDLKNSAGVADSLHAWVEAYVPGIGWMTLDPTWGEKFDEFGKSDLDHFAFAVWGEHDQTPDAVMAGSVDQNYQYENAILSYAVKVAVVAPAGKVSLSRFVVAPFVSFDHFTATAPPQVASDNNFLTVGAAKFDLGSLAPGQIASLNRFNLGKAWNQSAKVEFGRGSDQPLVLADATGKPIYWPMLGLAGLLVVGAGAGVVLRLRPRSAKVEVTEETDHQTA